MLPADLLHSIHRLGQSGDNIFSSVQKAREAEQVDVHHPAFGLKKDIIRLLANLVHGHQENQDKVDVKVSAVLARGGKGK